MKKIFSLLLIVAFFSAGGKKEAGDKKTQLTELKKQQAEINGKISAIEKELNLADTTKKVKTFFIQTTTATPSVFNHFVEMQGAVVAEDEYFLNAKVPGAITRTTLSVGQKVSAGQVVAEIE